MMFYCRCSIKEENHGTILDKQVLEVRLISENKDDI